MRPGLTKEIVRNQTAYRLGRSLVDGFVIAQVLLGVIAFVGIVFIIGQRPEPEHRLADLAGMVAAVCGAVVWGGAALLFRELAQAIFDFADCALLKHKAQSQRENPFSA